MYTFLIILGIYLIGVVYLHISLYFDWIKEDKCGSTIGDLYSFYIDQNGRSSSDIKDLIEHYENENAKVDDLIGDPIFIEE